MTEILLEYGQSISLGAVSKEEDMKQPGRILINPPPRDGRCEVCGKHISELKPFDGNLLSGRYNGALLVQRDRPDFPHSESIEKASEAFDDAYKAVSYNPEDVLPWLTSKYGKQEAEEIYHLSQLYGSTSPSWECRDCISLSEDEYFNATDKWRGEDTE